ncbi:uncharacterized protein [Pyrus communis]|uniref:uncharacterized protein isoform X1 n=1 Tax=Pyrus communis TaxID=23211 RepID=UPI0035C047F2
MYKMTCLAVAPHSSVQHNGSGRKDQQLRPGCKGGGDGLPDQKGLRSSVLGIPYQVHPPHTFSLGQVKPISLLPLLLFLYYLITFSVCYLLSPITFQFPTPIHKWNLPSLAPNTEVWLKVLAFFSLAKGLGYAINTSEELNVVKEIAATTGVVLDSVYSGKAAYGMMKDMDEPVQRPFSEKHPFSIDDF